MKKMLLLTAALIAALAGPAAAQDRRGGDRGPDRAQQAYPDRGGRTGGEFRGGDRGQRNFGQQAQQGQRDFGRQDGQRNFGQRGNGQQGFTRQQGFDGRGGFDPGVAAQQQNAAPQNFNRGDNRVGQRDFNRGGNFSGNRNDFRRDNDRRDFGRNNFRNDRFDGRRDGYGRNNYSDRRYSQYYRSFNADRRFRVGRYYGPSGYSYRRWSYGDFLPSLFWSSNYWLNNYYAYDLTPPFPGTVWVRYGDDALLIDRYTGEVIQVAYGIFW